MRPFQLVIFKFCAFSWVSATCAQPEIEKLIAESMPAIQAQIRATASAFLSGSRSEIKTNWKGFRELKTLKELAGDSEQLVKQVAIFAVTPTDQEFQSVFAFLVLRVLDLPPKIVIPVLAPYLDSDNKALRSFAQDWFENHDIREVGVSLSNPSVNYQDNLKYVHGCLHTNQEIPAAFIEYLYERSPDQALMVFYRAAGLGDSIAKMMEMRKEQETQQWEREKNGKDAEMKRELRETLKRFESEMRERDRNVQDPELRKRLEARWRERDKNRQDTQSLPPMPKPQPLMADEILRIQKTIRRLEKKPKKEILLAEHIVSNAIWLKKKKFGERFQKALPEAKQQLSKLAEMDRWWVRLYVAEIMRRHRDLRLGDVLEKLSRDSNALVSKSAKSVRG